MNNWYFWGMLMHSIVVSTCQPQNKIVFTKNIHSYPNWSRNHQHCASQFLHEFKWVVFGGVEKLCQTYILLRNSTKRKIKKNGWAKLRNWITYLFFSPGVFNHFNILHGNFNIANFRNSFTFGDSHQISIPTCRNLVLN